MKPITLLPALLPLTHATPSFPPSASPNPSWHSFTTRQATEIPPNSLYLIEWWPDGCGNGNGQSLSGGETTLAACVNVNSLWDEAPPDNAAVRFLFPEDDPRTFKWRLFGTQDCSEQIELGEGNSGICINVPNVQKVGAVIVFTEG